MVVYYEYLVSNVILTNSMPAGRVNLALSQVGKLCSTSPVQLAPPNITADANWQQKLITHKKHHIYWLAVR